MSTGGPLPDLRTQLLRTMETAHPEDNDTTRMRIHPRNDSSNPPSDATSPPYRGVFAIEAHRGVSMINKSWVRMRQGPCNRRVWGDVMARFALRARRFLSCRSSQPTPRAIIFPGHDLSLVEDAGDIYTARQFISYVQDAYVTWRIRSEPPNYNNNVTRNQKYSIITFFPLTLINQFRYFFNIFYLLVGASQLAPQFQIGPLFTYLAPLGFVVSMSLAKEATDDIKRSRRDRVMNNQTYEVVAPFSASELIGEGSADVRNEVNSELVVSTLTAAEIRTGHILRLHAGQRVPCDVIFLRTLAPDSDGTTFIRTDQLDGETDWKLRRAVGCVQNAALPELFKMDAVCEVEPPRKEIYDFCGSWTQHVDSTSALRTESSRDTVKESLGLENTLWTNSVVTAGPILALAIFTGTETRAAMHSTKSESKIGSFDLEVNRMSKFLCTVLLIFSFFLTNAKPLGPLSSIYFIRFVLLLSSIIPISLRVNLDMAKIVYSFMISRDKGIEGTVVRNSTLPEELGRIDVLFSDKTGTVTKNKMMWQRLAVTGKVYQLHPERGGAQLMRDFHAGLMAQDSVIDSTNNEPPLSLFGQFKESRRDSSARVRNLIAAVATCHSVMPTRDELSQRISYQASSPDEMALVSFLSKTMGVALTARTDTAMTLTVSGHGHRRSGPPVDITIEILEIFPFSSARKRMGIIIRERETDRIFYLLKGAEIAVVPCLAAKPQWLMEEVDTFARSGLRTLVFARHELTHTGFQIFRREYIEARSALVERELKCGQVIERLLERDMELLGITGVEDELQDEVAATIETLGQAGIKIWMLTGDKTETALCIATSAGLKGRHDNVIAITSDLYSTPGSIASALDSIAALQQPEARGASARSMAYGGDVVICVDGGVVEKLLNDPELAASFVERAEIARAVLCCRCSPTQKAQIVNMVKVSDPKLRLAAVGDGGNDVPMIQTAHCGIGIVGVEGKQASLASDFSILEFRHLKRLLLWHGRLSHQRSAKLSAFVVHRGLVISVIQVIFSAIFYFTPLALFQGWLQVGYATYYTMLPVFSLVLDVDLPESVAFLFPELYKSQKKEGGLSDKMFFRVLFKSIYQGAVIMVGVIGLFERQMMNLVSIAFTALILAELLNVCSEIMTWHPLMVAAEIATVIIYATSLLLLKEYFDIH